MVLYKSDIVNHGGDEYNIDYFAGSRQMISMEKVKTEGGFDYWNTKVTPQSAGIYGYKFILDNVKEYGRINFIRKRIIETQLRRI